MNDNNYFFKIARGYVFNWWRYVNFGIKCPKCDHKIKHHKSVIIPGLPQQWKIQEEPERERVNKERSDLGEKKNIEQKISEYYKLMDSILENSAKSNHYIECNSVIHNKDSFYVSTKILFPHFGYFSRIVAI